MRIAEHLDKQHKNHTSRVKLVDDYNYKGYCGEIFFAREFRMKFRFDDRIGGDNGIDFKGKITVDVKTVNLDGLKNMREARSRRHLLVKEGRVVADAYALCGYIPDGRCELMGWELAEVVKNVPPRVFPSVGGISNHVITAIDLRPISELRELIR